RQAIFELVNGLLQPYASKADHWAKILSVALHGQSFSDVRQSVERARRAAAISGDALDVHLESLISPEQLPKAERINLATMLVDAGLSQRNVQKLTGVARDTLRSHSQPETTARKRRGT
ncbi:MAG TPA: AAA family ATPase, partial [Tianweitania sediminis]|nr:AAA family ATPase [Tianweitania sediminis]